MFAPRRLCVYPPPLLASIFPSANFFVSPTCRKFARNPFVSPTYAITGGWGSVFLFCARHTILITRYCLPISFVCFLSFTTNTTMVSNTVNVDAPTFPFWEFLFSLKNQPEGWPLQRHGEPKRAQYIVPLHNPKRKQNPRADRDVGDPRHESRVTFLWYSRERSTPQPLR